MKSSKSKKPLIEVEGSGTTEKQVRPMKSRDRHDFKKDEKKYSSDRREDTKNDVAWYTKYGEIATSAARLPWGTIVGAQLPSLGSGSLYPNPDKSTSFEPVGVMRLLYYISIGELHVRE